MSLCIVNPVSGNGKSIRIYNKFFKHTKLFRTEYHNHIYDYFLDNLEKIYICTAYEFNGKTISTPPVDAENLSKCKPIYEEHLGWQSSTMGITKYNKLPKEACNYLERISELTQTPIDIISTGPERNETIVLKNPFT